MLLTVVFTLNGCGFRDEPDVEIKKAVLYGPDGEFEFRKYKKNPFLFVTNDGEKYTIGMSIFPLDGTTNIEFYYKKHIALKEGKAYYQLNGGDKTKLVIQRKGALVNEFNIISPETMDYYSSDGDGLHVTRQRQKITRKHRKKAKKQTYRYYIPFTLDDKDYAIDVTFKLKLKSTPFIGVPGMP